MRPIFILNINAPKIMYTNNSNVCFWDHFISKLQSYCSYKVTVEYNVSFLFGSEELSRRIPRSAFRGRCSCSFCYNPVPSVWLYWSLQPGQRQQTENILDWCRAVKTDCLLIGRLTVWFPHQPVHVSLSKTLNPPCLKILMW